MRGQIISGNRMNFNARSLGFEWRRDEFDHRHNDNASPGFAGKSPLLPAPPPFSFHA
jgi:hypothetical protein